MITTGDFDEIVINNPFLTNGNTGYGFRKWFWQFQINYDPDSLQFPGQSNSTCKYIIIENDLTKVTYKVIREDKEVTVQELFPKKEYTRETITDPKKLSKIENKFNDLKKIVKKQIEKHNGTLRRVEQSKVRFDFDSISEFLDLLLPAISTSQKDKLVKEIEEVEKNPMSYFDEPTNTIASNSKNIVLSIFFDELVDNLEQFGTLMIVDWKSPYKEVKDLIVPVFNKLGIAFNESLNRGKEYETTSYLNNVSDMLLKEGYAMVILGGVSDTFLITLTKEQDYKDLETKAKNIKIEIRKWRK